MRAIFQNESLVGCEGLNFYGKIIENEGHIFYDKGVTQTVIPVMLPVTDHDAQDFTGKKIENTGVPQRFQVEHEATVFPLELPISVVFNPFHVPYAFTNISVSAVPEDTPEVDVLSVGFFSTKILVSLCLIPISFAFVPGVDDIFQGVLLRYKSARRATQERL